MTTSGNSKPLHRTWLLVAAQVSERGLGMTDELVLFLRRRLTIARLAQLEVHQPCRLWLEGPWTKPNSTPMFVATVCASCSPEWTDQQREQEWGAWHWKWIPRWVERWPCRHLQALAAAFDDGERWRAALDARLHPPSDQ
jgi:hypothetical protein